MTLTESFTARYEALEYAMAQKKAYKGALIVVSGSPGAFTVMTTIRHLEGE